MNNTGFKIYLGNNIISDGFYSKGSLHYLEQSWIDMNDTLTIYNNQFSNINNKFNTIDTQLNNKVSLNEYASISSYGIAAVDGRTISANNGILSTIYTEKVGLYSSLPTQDGASGTLGFIITNSMPSNEVRKNGYMYIVVEDIIPTYDVVFKPIPFNNSNLTYGRYNICQPKNEYKSDMPAFGTITLSGFAANEFYVTSQVADVFNNRSYGDLSENVVFVRWEDNYKTAVYNLSGSATINNFIF